MSFKTKFIASIVLLTALTFTACGGAGGAADPGSSNPDGETEDTTIVVFETGFDTAVTEGDTAIITAGLKTIKMICANNSSTDIVFPRGVDDSSTGTVSRKFFICETEVTNALIAEVLQWALDNGKINETGTSNLVNAATVKYGNAELLDLDSKSGDINYVKISFNTSTHKFSVADGYENHPVVCVSWRGAVIFCNWLTEMRDGNKINCVYSGIDSSWHDDETIEDASKTGYRLPSSNEWEYAARYIGKTAPTEENVKSECIYYNKGNLFTTLTADYYWTPGDYASGAIKDINDSTENNAVAWYYKGNIQAVSGKTANQLGVYDMSGNTAEWCFTAVSSTYGYKRVRNGGSFGDHTADYLRIGLEHASYTSSDFTTGFRFVRTR